MDETTEIEITIKPHKVYARPNATKQVRCIFSTCFEQPQEGDVLVKEGNGDDYVHVGYYQLYDHEGLHNYKIVDDAMVETTAEEKTAELAARPTPPPTAEEQILQLQAVVIDLQYQNRLKEMERL